MALTLKEAIKIANKKKYAPKLISIKEYADRYVFYYTNENNETMYCSGGLYVMKGSGKTGVFFPPDYDDEYFFSGVEIPVPDDI